jgi:methionyl-tRNA formyltransferase
MKMKIIFMGTPEFAIPTLKQLIASDHEIVAVYTQRPKLAGRGQKETLTPIHQLALENQLEVCTPKSLRGDEAAEIFKSHGADVAVIVAYGLILPNSISIFIHQTCLDGEVLLQFKELSLQEILLVRFVSCKWMKGLILVMFY